MKKGECSKQSVLTTIIILLSFVSHRLSKSTNHPSLI